MLSLREPRYPVSPTASLGGQMGHIRIIYTFVNALDYKYGENLEILYNVRLKVILTAHFYKTNFVYIFLFMLY